MLVAVQLFVTRIISPTSIENVGSLTTPDDHFVASPDGRVGVSSAGGIRRAGICPAVRDRIISPTSFEIIGEITSAPHDHFIASPYCGVLVSRGARH